MQALGFEGAKRSRRVKTTTPDPARTRHSDSRSRFTSIRFSESLAEIGAVLSIGKVGDSFDNSLAETVNGYYKVELVGGPDHPRSLENH